MDGQSCQPLRNPYLTPYPKLNTTSTLKWRTPGCRQDLSNPDPPLSPSPLPWLPGPRGGQPPAGQPRRRGGSACRCPYNSSIGEAMEARPLHPTPAEPRVRRARVPRCTPTLCSWPPPLGGRTLRCNWITAPRSSPTLTLTLRQSCQPLRNPYLTPYPKLKHYLHVQVENTWIQDVSNLPMTSD